MNQETVIPPSKALAVAARDGILAPRVIAAAGDKAARRFLEFFAATIRNKNTRMAYYRAAVSNSPRRHDRTMKLIRSERSPSEEQSDAVTMRLLCVDAVTVPKALPPASVDMCLTSPPYWGHREYDVLGIGQGWKP